MVKPEIEFPNLHWNLCWKIDKESSGTSGLVKGPKDPISHMSREDACLLLLASFVNRIKISLQGNYELV